MCIVTLNRSPTSHMNDFTIIDLGLALFHVLFAEVMQGTFRQAPSGTFILNVPLVVLIVGA